MTHPEAKKSAIMMEVADKLGLPVVDIKLSIPNQMEGLPILENPNINTKVDYHLKAQSGRLVMTFDNPIRADREANERGLNLYKVTTITEKM